MEWEYPKPHGHWVWDITVPPVNFHDLVLFTARKLKTDDNMMDEIFLEMMAASYQVQTVQQQIRHLNETIRGIERSKKPCDMSELRQLYIERQALQYRAAALREALRRPRFGKLFPRTRHNICRQMARLATKTWPQPQNLTKNEGGAVDFTQKTSCSDHFLKALCPPGSVSENSVSGSAAFSVQFNQCEVKVDISASFWDGKLTNFQEFIAKGKI